MRFTFTNRPASSIVTHIAVAAVGFGFDSQVSQIGHIVAKRSTPLQSFFEGVLSRCYAAEMGPAIRSLHTLTWHRGYNKALILLNFKLKMPPTGGIGSPRSPF